MQFDILFPVLLFGMTVLGMFLSKKAEPKLKTVVEEREFRNRDIALLIGMIAIAVSVIVFIPQMAIMAIFLFSYSTLLFTVSYAFSDMPKNKVMFFCAVNGLVALVAGILSFLGFSTVELRIFAIFAFSALTAVSFFISLYSWKGNEGKLRWYVAGLSPALFLLLFIFFNGTPVWYPFLLDAYGLIFAILIVLYLNSLFTWKTVIVFGVALTVMDIILVWVTGAMVQTANAVSNLGLPVLVAFPTIPFIILQGGIAYLRLGLGDFFFAGILATQTLKKFGKKIALLSVATMSVSFALFELLLLNPTNIGALPATLPILLGWTPVVGWKILQDKKRKKATIA
jgi:hypothetical protein